MSPGTTLKSLFALLSVQTCFSSPESAESSAGGRARGEPSDAIGRHPVLEINVLLACDAIAPLAGNAVHPVTTMRRGWTCNRAIYTYNIAHVHIVCGSYTHIT